MRLAGEVLDPMPPTRPSLLRFEGHILGLLSIRKSIVLTLIQGTITINTVQPRTNLNRTEDRYP